MKGWWQKNKTDKKARQGCVWQNLSTDWTSAHGVTQMSKIPTAAPSHKVRQVSNSPFLYIQKWYIYESDPVLRSTKTREISDLSFLLCRLPMLHTIIVSLVSYLWLHRGQQHSADREGWPQISVCNENSSTSHVGTSKIQVWDTVLLYLM